MLNFLQQYDISVLAKNFGNCQIEVDGRVVRVCIIPALAELHIELKNFERTHVCGTALSNCTHNSVATEKKKLCSKSRCRRKPAATNKIPENNRVPN